MMYPIFFNPFTNQISYSFRTTNQSSPTFVPISQDSIQKTFPQNQHEKTIMGNLTLNAQKLNKDLHDQNLRNIRRKKNNASLPNNKKFLRKKNSFKIIENRRSEEPGIKGLSPGLDDSSFETGNQKINNIKLSENNNNEERDANYMNVQINVEFDPSNIEMTKKQFKNIINENLQAMQSSILNVKNIKVLFAESYNSTPQVSSELKSDQQKSHSISLISTSEKFDLEAQQTLKENLWNVIRNSLLYDSYKIEHKNILFQTSKIVFQILNTINFSNNISFEKNFFCLFNLQIPIDLRFFKNLSPNSKVKILCYLFCKYFKKGIISTIYEDFYEEVSISEICSDNRAKSNINSKIFYVDIQGSKESAREETEEKVFPHLNQIENEIDIETIFPDCQNNSNDYILIRKLLILLIHQINLFKDYLRIKLGEDSGFKSPKSSIRKLRQTIINQQMNDTLFSIDPTYLLMSIPQLLDTVSIRDVQLYVAISNVDYIPKRISKIVHFVMEDKKVNFEMTIFERDFILIPKIKRKDEKIKFVFKSIRKQLFNDFKMKSKNNHSVLKIKKMFNIKYLHGNEESIQYFYSNDLSKKKLKILSNCNRLIHNMKVYKNEKYIKDQIEISIYRKSEDFLLNEQMRVADFKKILFDRQSKHTWILQDILNAIPSFETFFVFSKYRKRIKKKKDKEKK